MATHTPGPWTARLDDAPFWVAPPKATDNVICDLQPRDADVFTEEDEANARLIAAAPDMFRFVEAFAACPTEGEVPGHWSDKAAMDEMIRVARAIVAKAEGR